MHTVAVLLLKHIDGVGGGGVPAHTHPIALLALLPFLFVCEVVVIIILNYCRLNGVQLERTLQLYPHRIILLRHGEVR